MACFYSNNCVKYESNGDRSKRLSFIECLYTIKPYLKDIINNLKKCDAWEIQSITAIIFISRKDIDGECETHPKCDNIEFMIYEKPDEVIKYFFESLLDRHEIGSEASMRGNYFIFVCVNLLRYKCHTINLILDRSYIDSLDWIKKEKINQKFYQ